MKIIYVAGPFRAPDAWGIESNVRRAEIAGYEVARLGYMPLIPHANTRFFHGGPFTDSFWLEGTQELLRRCDAILMIEGWDLSEGSKAELKLAEELGLGIFYSLQELREYEAYHRDNEPR